MGQLTQNSIDLDTAIAMANALPDAGDIHDLEDALLERDTVIDITNHRITRIGPSVFRDCSIIQSFVGDNIVTLEERAFYTCARLTTVSFPKATLLRDYAMYGCKVLVNVYLPLTETVRGSAFQGDVKLSKLDFPSLTTIYGQHVFQNTNLKTLILRAPTVVTLGNTNSFMTTPVAEGTGYVYVPADLVESYKTATNWSTYANQIRSIDELEGA